MTKKETIAKLQEENAALVDSNNSKTLLIKELQQINELITADFLKCVLSTELPEAEEPNSPENPLLLNDILNSIIAKSVIEIDKEGIDDFNLCELSMLNDLKI